jgi:MFS superfamily sulfate permease-like transporter
LDFLIEIAAACGLWHCPRRLQGSVVANIITFLPLAVIAAATFFIVRSIHAREAAGRAVPDRGIGIITAVAGVIFLVVIADSWIGVAVALILLGLSAYAWYRHFRQQELAGEESRPRAGDEGLK